MIRVLLVEDSPRSATVVRELVAGDPSICIVAEARHANAAHAARAHAADVALFGVPSRAPGVLEALRQLAQRALPVLGVLHPGNGPASAYCALEAGAFDVVWLHSEPSAELSRQLASALRRTAYAGSSIPARSKPACRMSGAQPRLVAVGSSAGGPSALRALLTHLPDPMPLPVVIAQHIDHGFLDALVAWISEVRSCEQAASGARPEPNRVYFAPEAHDLTFTADGSFRVAPADAGCFHPCVDRLFESAARVFGTGAVGVVLSGMGSDGARGCTAIRGAGGTVLVQSPGSAAVPGMPSAALETGAAGSVDTPERLGAWFQRLARPILRVVG